MILEKYNLNQGSYYLTSSPAPSEPMVYFEAISWLGSKSLFVYRTRKVITKPVRVVHKGKSTYYHMLFMQEQCRRHLMTMLKTTNKVPWNLAKVL